MTHYMFWIESATRLKTQWNIPTMTFECYITQPMVILCYKNRPQDSYIRSEDFVKSRYFNIATNSTTTMPDRRASKRYIFCSSEILYQCFWYGNTLV